MAVGIVGYLSQRGLGTMVRDMRKHLGITRQLVIPDAPWPADISQCSGEEFFLFKWQIDREDLEAWRGTDKITTLISIETPFGHNTFRWAKELGMKTILVVMWEAFHPRSPGYKNVDLYVCPSFRCYQEVPYDNKVFLPYPVDTEEFQFKERDAPARVFIHNAGTGGLGGRKGTREAVLGFLKANVSGATLLVRCQTPFHEICPDIELSGYSDRIKVQYGNTETKAELYAEGDVLIAPSKYEGHALVALEGMAAGLPVITTDADPMNEYWKSDYPLLVQVAETQPAGMVNPHCVMNIPSIDDIAAKIRWCADSANATQLKWLGEVNRRIAELHHSWDALRDRWKQRLGI